MATQAADAVAITGGQVEGLLCFDLRAAIGTDSSLANGSNAAVDPLTSLVFFIEADGPTAAFDIDGLVAPTSGNRLLYLYNNTGQNMTIKHQSGVAAAADRIITTTGADISTSGNGCALLVYYDDFNRWYLLSLQA
jgi:hypothetical protein